MIDFEQGILNSGDPSRIRACMARAAAGEPITVGFLGGSITQGSLASSPETCYAYLVYRWWADRFPQVRYVNAGIGGTNSQFGVARVQEDLLCHKPDFVLMEFSVNDDDTPHFRETYEGLVRRLLKSGCALLLLQNVCYDTGHNAERAHLSVAQHYHVPCVSVRPTIFAALQRGALQNRDITPDDLHPNDAGHALVAQGVIHLLQKLYGLPACPPSDAPLPPPLTENRYENSRRYRAGDTDAACNGFTADPTPQIDITQCFRRGYFASDMGSTITLRIPGRCIAVQYRKSVAQPTPIATAWVDGAHETALDGNFDQTWGDCLYLQTLAEGLDDGLHTVTATVTHASQHDAVPFYLVSVIGE